MFSDVAAMIMLRFSKMSDGNWPLRQTLEPLEDDFYRWVENPADKVIRKPADSVFPKLHI